MSLIGSTVKFKWGYKDDTTHIGVIRDKYQGLIKTEHTGPWPSGGRGDFDGWSPVEFYIIQRYDKNKGTFVDDSFIHIKCSDVVGLSS